MKQYEHYKNAFIGWIDEIPSHWNVIRLAFAGKFLKGSGISKSDITDHGSAVILYGDIYTKYNIKANSFTRYTSKEITEASTEINSGDILFAGSGETKEDIGKCIVYTGSERAYAGGDIIILRPNANINSLFLSYLLNSENIRWEKAKISRGDIIVHIYSSKLRDIAIPLPPVLEQLTIANYLDRKTSQIDTLISKKEKLIELLQEERTAIINQAVTKGIDPNVPMKDSGIEWLGEIPEHWEVKKLKYVTYMKSGDNITSDQIKDEGDYPVYGGNGLRGYNSDYTHEGNYVLIGRQGALCGNINYASKKFWASEHAIVCHLNANHNWIWLGELLTIMNLNQYSQSAAQPGLAVEKIKNLSIPIPPEMEQKQLKDFVLTTRNRIEEITKRTLKEIKLLTEYKTALISEVVTGKIDVRDEV